MHYVVFIPGQTNATDGLREVGLLPLAENVSFEPCPHGPDGTAGVLCQWMTNRGVVRGGYNPARQKWVPAVADGPDFPSGRYWVGFWNDSPPTPEELARTYLTPGSAVVLGDGNEWQFPCVSHVPHTLRRDDDGSTRFIPQRKWHSFTLAAARWRQVFRDMPVGGQVLVSDLRDFLELGLSANYRLIPEVADELALWTTGGTGTVWTAAAAMLTPDVPAGVTL